MLPEEKEFPAGMPLCPEPMDNEEEILVTRASMPSYEEFIEEIRPIWDTAWMTNMGEFHEKLMEQLKEYLKVQKAASVCQRAYGS